MRLTYGNIVRVVYLVLFIISSIVALAHYHTNAVIISALCLVGFIAFDIICYFRKKIEPVIIPDINPELKRLLEKQEAMETKFNTIASEAGLAKLASTFRR
jgi:hypothetical protein